MSIDASQPGTDETYAGVQEARVDQAGPLSHARALPALRNIPSYFLWLINVFAVRAMPAIVAFAELGASSAISSFAAWLASFVQSKTGRRA